MGAGEDEVVGVKRDVTMWAVGWEERRGNVG